MASDRPTLIHEVGPAASDPSTAEARLHSEGFDCFRWYDVPGAKYPRHRHPHDECIWVLEGEIHFGLDDAEHSLRAGDRLYLPARTPHTATVPPHAGVTYLVGQKLRSF